VPLRNDTANTPALRIHFLNLYARLKKTVERAMKSLGLQSVSTMKSVYRLRAMVDETNREQWLAESKKWRDRAELEIRRIFGRVSRPRRFSI
jgi:hypothetical protein